jgi:hypothetical protein
MDVHPSYEFWESDLEVPVNLLLNRFQNLESRKLWLDSLSGKQLSIIFQHCFKSHLNGQLFQDGDYDDRSTQQKRKILASYSDSLFNYYLISYFDRTRLEPAVSEIARSVLTQELISPYLIKNNIKYDKKSLLFLLFHTNHDLLKSVYYFDKIQRKGFSSFILQKPPRKLTSPFKDFVSQETIQQILKDEKLENQLQGIFHYQNRVYVLMRQASYIDLLLNSNKVVHGHKPDWVILDFLLTGTQVDISAKNIKQAIVIANSIASCYFDSECVFIKVQDKNFPLQVHKFLQACIEGSDSDICIFELKFKSPHLKNNNTYITLSVKPYDLIAPELYILEPAIGNILQSIQSAKLMFKDKKLTLFFEPSGKIDYLEHPLNKKEREDFKTHMKTLYGLTILPRASC